MKNNKNNLNKNDLKNEIKKDNEIIEEVEFEEVLEQLKLELDCYAEDARILYQIAQNEEIKNLARRQFTIIYQISRYHRMFIDYGDSLVEFYFKNGYYLLSKDDSLVSELCSKQIAQLKEQIEDAEDSNIKACYQAVINTKSILMKNLLKYKQLQADLISNALDITKAIDENQFNV